ncbi:MAG: hypothetical protein WCH04_09140 [Gammaproteobacteria bacterium]
MKRNFSLLSAWVSTFLGACALGLTSALSATDATYEPWPTNTAVVTADAQYTFKKRNLSGLYFQPATHAQGAVLWGVQNEPPTLYKLVWNGSIYVMSATGDWCDGKTLRYPNGTGKPDAEGVTMAEPSSSAIYVSTERDDDGGSNRFSVLRYDTNAEGDKLNATHEWNLTSDLPTVVENNKGLEAIAWVPDCYLVGNHFRDEKRDAAYDPANYPAHGTGLFFVGLEADGRIYAYALNHSDSTYARIATIDSGQEKIVDLSFDFDSSDASGALWAYCDDDCGNKSTVLGIDTTSGSDTFGQFIVRRAFKPPVSMCDNITCGKINNEGIAMAPRSECRGNLRTFFWADDDATNDYSIRRGTVPCDPLF